MKDLSELRGQLERIRGEVDNYEQRRCDLMIQANEITELHNTLGYVEALLRFVDMRIARFNAAAWFVSATPWDIESLFSQGLRDSRICDYMEECSIKVQEALRENEEAVLECKVDRDDALAWLKKWRPDVLQRLVEDNLVEEKDVE